jgi:hypothetical protein
MGIFKLENRVTGEIYVGSSLSLQNKLFTLYTALACGQHEYSPLQESWIRHGPQSFRFSILELVKDRYTIELCEAKWLHDLRAHSIDGKSANLLRLRAPGTHISVGRDVHAELRQLGLGSFNDTIVRLIDSYRSSPSDDQ